MEITPEIKEKIDKLNNKFASMGQDINSYLDGLLFADYLTYWDYINLDVLLNLQQPKTSIPDERIFIIYHQITELYFKLCLNEFELLDENSKSLENIKERLRRVNRYFEALTKSFEIMIDGMAPEQFLQFRMSLLPASGFQSAQYRKIEICSAEMNNLVVKKHRGDFSENPDLQEIEKMFEIIYWKYGATELGTGKKTLTLKQFEQKYEKELLGLAKEKRHTNVAYIYKNLSEVEQKDQSLIDEMRLLDLNVNVKWPLMHYKSAVRYLQKDPADIAATGGTNWQKYLPPRFQMRMFFPYLWSEEEIENWGKKGV
jgi:tryptophan 2,3-dioxygenase